MIIQCLEQGPRRFTEIRVPLRHATAKVLTQNLRALERDGMITRTVYAEVPPRVEYELTPLGRTLLGLVAACRHWAEANMPTLLTARDAYEKNIGEAGGMDQASPSPAEISRS